MKQDFKIDQDNLGFFDLVIDEENREYSFVDGMETAVDFQLFVDRRSNRDDVSVPRRRQGWIGDLLTREEGLSVGSLVYLKNQSRNTQLDKNEIAAFARDSLEYFVSIGAAKEITANVVGDNIEGEIKIQSDVINQYSRLWRATDAINI